MIAQSAFFSRINVDQRKQKCALSFVKIEKSLEITASVSLKKNMYFNIRIFYVKDARSLTLNFSSKIYQNVTY